MIKVIIKEAKELKTANENVLEAINDFVVNNKLSNKESQKYFDVGLEQLLYLDNKKSLGLPFLYNFHILNKSSTPEINANWDKQRATFNDAYLSSVKSKQLPVKVECKIDNSQTAIAKAGAATVKDKSLFLIVVYLNNVNVNTFKSKIAHEFRHFTQRVNDICIYYGEQLNKLKDPNKVKMTEIQKIPSKFGLGRDVTGTSKTVSAKDKFSAAGGDIEYETYLADLIYAYYNRLMKEPEKITNDIQSMGVNAAAVKYTKLLFDVYRYKSSYTNINGIIENILQKRPKEFPKDVLALLSNKFSAL